MANQLQLPPFTIREAIKRIDNNSLLLPAIQRRFVWETDQIEMLFDSMMQDYPINTFMFWEVKENEIKSNFRFYEFLKKYIEYEGGVNPFIDTRNHPDFYAVIDGQQRLNSFYIGFKGTYAVKNYTYRRKKYYKNDEDYPPQRLYLDLLSKIENDEEKKVYDFRFLEINGENPEYAKTEKEIEIENQKELVPCHWFEVGKILTFQNSMDVSKYLIKNDLGDNANAIEILGNLFDKSNSQLINFFLETNQEFDKILFSFIRTNSGGTKLSFSDLLMSIITASWESHATNKGAREEIDCLVKEIEDYGYIISQDFILKTCLVILSDDVKFSLKNFNHAMISKIKDNWPKILKSIKACFELLNTLSFGNQALRAKNAAIPIIYYLFKTGKSSSINKDNINQEERLAIKKYLYIVMLKKLFGGSSDGFLTSLKKVIDSSEEQIFPLLSMKKQITSINRNFSFSEESLNELLRTPYDNVDSYYILALLYPNFNFDFKNPNVDHLHPRDAFKNQTFDFLENEIDKKFFAENWNTVLNLALLSEENNKSKGKGELKAWIEKQERYSSNLRNELLIPSEVDLDFHNFKQFIQEREILLKKRILENI